MKKRLTRNNRPPVWLREKLEKRPGPARRIVSSVQLPQTQATTAHDTPPSYTGSYPALTLAVHESPGGKCTATTYLPAQNISPLEALWIKHLGKELVHLLKIGSLNYSVYGGKPWPENKSNGNTGYHRARPET